MLRPASRLESEIPWNASPPRTFSPCGECIGERHGCFCKCSHAAGFLAVAVLSIPAKAGALKIEAGDRHVIDVQWPGWQGSLGYGQEWQGRREHCERMRERLREIRYRMQFAPPWERDQMGARFHGIRERLRHECWGHWREDE